MTTKDRLSLGGFVEELVRQDWEVAVSADGKQYHAQPPSKSAIVSFTTTPPPGEAMTLILRDLRSHGFRWPPFEVEPKPTSTPFAAKPHPFGGTKLTNGVAASTVAPPAPSIDVLFERLKEARSYVALAREDLPEVERAYNAAKTRLDACRAEIARAEQDLEKRKAEFDAQFAKS